MDSRRSEAVPEEACFKAMSWEVVDGGGAGKRE